jgi:hypothetical protein
MILITICHTAVDAVVGEAHMPNILILTSVVGGGHVFRDLAIAQELRRILPSGYEIIFASGGNAYEMLQEEGVCVEKISAPDFPVHLGTADFFADATGGAPEAGIR